MFAIPLIGSTTLRNALPRWLRWTSITGLCATLCSFLISAYPFVDVVNPRAYAAKILGTTLLSNALGYLFYRTDPAAPNHKATPKKERQPIGSLSSPIETTHLTPER
jgi:hypothetical protein